MAQVKRQQLRRLLQGDKPAWDAFVGEVAPIIYGAIRSMLLLRTHAVNEADARDVFQDVFLRLIKDGYHLLKSYDPSRASLSTWLTIVARSVTIDCLRRKRAGHVPLEEDSEELAAAPQPPRLALDLPSGVLSARQRLVLQLVFDHEMTVEEIARCLGVDAQTVRSTKHKALTRLRRYMTAAGLA